VQLSDLWCRKNAPSLSTRTTWVGVVGGTSPLRASPPRQRPPCTQGRAGTCLGARKPLGLPSSPTDHHDPLLVGFGRPHDVRLLLAQATVDDKSDATPRPNARGRRPRRHRTVVGPLPSGNRFPGRVRLEWWRSVSIPGTSSGRFSVEAALDLMAGSERTPMTKSSTFGLSVARKIRSSSSNRWRTSPPMRAPISRATSSSSHSLSR
jgi:hypothetical protein